MSADNKTLAQRDEMLALSVVDGKSPHKRQRRRRCTDCGLLFEPDEVIKSFDEDGRRDGWVCHNCY